jgi:hypothetical protein
VATSEPVRSRSRASGPPLEARVSCPSSGRPSHSAAERSCGTRSSNGSTASAALDAAATAGVNAPNHPSPTRTSCSDGASRGSVNCSLAGTVKPDRYMPAAAMRTTSTAARRSMIRPSVNA